VSVSTVVALDESAESLAIAVFVVRSASASAGRREHEDVDPVLREDGGEVLGRCLTVASPLILCFSCCDGETSVPR